MNFTDIEVELGGNQVVRTCPAALGPGFAAGTTDGPGAFGFQQGDTEVVPMATCNLINQSSKNKQVQLRKWLLFSCYVLYIQINKFWKQLRNLLKKPSQYQEACQQPKPVLLSTGEMFEPYAWAVGLINRIVLDLQWHFCHSKNTSSDLLFMRCSNVILRESILILYVRL